MNETVEKLSHQQAKRIETITEATHEHEGYHYDVTYCALCGKVLRKLQITDPKIGNTSDETKEESSSEGQISYRNLEGENQTWQKGSVDGAQFAYLRSSDNAVIKEHFTGIQIDNRYVDQTNYMATYAYIEDSAQNNGKGLIITLDPEHLEALSAGEHSITVEFDDGNDPMVSFSIIEKDDEVPEKKGFSLWWLLAILLATLSFFLFFLFKRRKDEKE